MESANAAAERRLKWVLVGLLFALVVAPLAVARYPPLLDLAQQSAQIRLFGEAWTNPDGPYRIEWSSPNKLSYPILGIALWLGGAEWGPRLALLGCGALFVASIWSLARRLGRPPENAALACIFLYAGTYYGGFLNFIVGATGFVLWLILLFEEDGTNARRSWAMHFAAACLLYLGHLLWLAVAGYILIVVGQRRRSFRGAALGIVALAPFGLAALLWYSSLEDLRWGGTIEYGSLPWQRLIQASSWSTWPLGGLEGPWEDILLLALLGWAAICLRPSNPRRSGGERWLAKVALALALLALLLPDNLGDTANLARRWMPWAAICGLLALPPCGLSRRVQGIVATLLVGGHAVVTATDWRGFDREEMRGFAAAVAAVPDGSRLLELDFARRSPRFWIEPFYQLAAYTQLDRRVILGYSFASTPSSLVVFDRDGAGMGPWTPGLEHNPERLLLSDLDRFDYLLVHAAPREQPLLVHWLRRVESVAGEASWVLYRTLPKGDAS